MACLSARQSAYTKTKHGFTVHWVTAPSPSMDTNKVHFENLDSSSGGGVSSCLVLLKAEGQPEENTGHRGLERTSGSTAT